MRVTIFGAESTGKTTLGKTLVTSSAGVSGHYLPEWARPYLENTSPVITTEAMTRIWHGQRALQDSARYLVDKPFIIQDSDLFSTVGFWDFWDGNTPEGLVQDALKRKSDLYIITRSNIPFAPDIIRYGDGVRETTDQYWIDLCEKYDLNYKVIDEGKPQGFLTERVFEAADMITSHFDATRNISFKREVQP